MRPPIELMKTIRPRGAADRRQHRLGHRDLGGQVDLDLAAEVLDRDRLQRARDRDAGVVDEAVEAAPAARLADCARRGGDLRGVGDVEQQRVPAAPSPPARSDSASSSLRTPAKTVQPSWSIAVALARPMPVEAPVTRTDGIGARLTSRRCSPPHS